MKKQRFGFIVMQFVEGEILEVPVTLKTGPTYPPEGILEYRSGTDPIHLFGNRDEARAAIRRTDAYRAAFGDPGGDKWPNGPTLKIVPIVREVEI